MARIGGAHRRGSLQRIAALQARAARPTSQRRWWRACASAGEQAHWRARATQNRRVPGIQLCSPPVARRPASGRGGKAGSPLFTRLEPTDPLRDKRRSWLRAAGNAEGTPQASYPRDAPWHPGRQAQPAAGTRLLRGSSAQSQEAGNKKGSSTSTRLGGSRRPWMVPCAGGASCVLPLPLPLRT